MSKYVIAMCKARKAHSLMIAAALLNACLLAGHVEAGSMEPVEQHSRGGHHDSRQTATTRLCFSSFPPLLPPPYMSA